MAYSPQQFKKLLKSIASQRGPRSAVGSIRPERLNAIAERMNDAGVELTEFAAIAWVSAFHKRYPTNFFTAAETEQNIRRLRSAANAPRKPEDDATRAALRAMSPEEKLEFANRRDLPQAAVYTIENENLVRGDE